MPMCACVGDVGDEDSSVTLVLPHKHIHTIFVESCSFHFCTEPTSFCGFLQVSLPLPKEISLRSVVQQCCNPTVEHSFLSEFGCNLTKEQSTVLCAFELPISHCEHVLLYQLLSTVVTTWFWNCLYFLTLLRIKVSVTVVKLYCGIIYLSFSSKYIPK